MCQLFAQGEIGHHKDQELLARLTRGEREKFRKLLGFSAKKLLKRWRVSYGLWLMEHRGLTVLKAAPEAGFHDSPHFIHAVRELTGLAPRRYLEAKMQGNGGGLVAAEEDFL